MTFCFSSREQAGGCYPLVLNTGNWLCFVTGRQEFDFLLFFPRTGQRVLPARGGKNLGLFNKKTKEVQLRIYKSNKLAHSVTEAEPAENEIEEEQHPAIPVSISLEESTEPEEAAWQRCPACASVTYSEDLEANMQVCPKCSHHIRLSARKRIEYTADEGTFQELNAELIGGDPLGFPGYPEKLEKMREATGEAEAIVTGECEIEGNPCVIAVMNGYFMMGSMGAAVGEKFTLAVEKAIEKKLPFIAFTVSGGARMQEGLVSLMQMSKTAAALGKLDEAGLLYIVVLTDPTTGGVTASIAMLGDVTIAEPGAVVGFTGRRVIEQTIKQVLPATFQKAEFVMEKGFIDLISPRSELKSTLGQILSLHKEAENE